MSLHWPMVFSSTVGDIRTVISSTRVDDGTDDAPRRVWKRERLRLKEKAEPIGMGYWRSNNSGPEVLSVEHAFLEDVFLPITEQELLAQLRTIETN